ncbi:glycosyltransferase [Bradyrhizobium sp. RT5a]|uniref:glycosyltransferase family 2 protein n=1 Tax=Bradyrhizobium sp. RT5a TaxID=3156380 RepID=UPI0033949F4E
MRYLRATVDLDQELPSLCLKGYGGLALTVVRRGRLIEFVLKETGARDSFSASEVSQLIFSHANVAIVADQIRYERGRSLPAKMPSVTVAICTRDRPEWVDRCLSALTVLNPAPSELTAAFEVLVVDNAPPDGRTADVVARHTGVRYVVEPKTGLNFGRNRALREAKGHFLAYIDDDVVVTPGWLAGLHEAWNDNPDAIAFTGLVLPFALETEAQVLFERRGGFRRGFQKKRFCAVDLHNPLAPCGAGVFGAGANMAFDRKIVVEIGGFDEALDTGAPLPGGGDLDMFYRMARIGKPFVYEPQFAVLHDHRRESKQLRRQYWTWGLAHMAFIVKSYRSDRAFRAPLRKLVRWWFVDQISQLWKSLRGRHVLPPAMVALELWGGVVGLFGEYDRSVRRVAKIRDQQ